MEATISLVIPFIALSILNSMMNVFKSAVFNNLEQFFDKEKKYCKLVFKISYYSTFILSYIIVYYANFNFFNNLGITFRYIEIDFFLTAFLLCGSTLFLENVYKSLNDNVPIRFDSLTAVAKSKGKSLVENYFHDKKNTKS